MAFIDLMKSETKLSKTETTNGAIAYETSGKELLDFNFHITTFRCSPEYVIIDSFSKAYYENPEAAVLYLFYLRDCRGGLGEKRIFKICFKWMVNNPWAAWSKKGASLLDISTLRDVRVFFEKLIPEYGCWKDVVDLAVDEEDCVSQFISMLAIKTEMTSFLDSYKTSLLAKWLPSVNASSRKTRKKAYKIISESGWNRYNYQEIVRDMRKRLNTVESQISANKWDEVNYAAVPSKANLKYNTAFLKHDPMRRLEFLQKVSEGKAGIHAGTLQPHEIVKQYYDKRYNETLEQLWKALPVDEELENTLVIRDGSGSMCCPVGGGVSCLDVATSLSIFLAEHNSGDWKDKFVTFSSRPEIVDLSRCRSLKEKIDVCYRYYDCSNTDIYKTMMLILDTAVKNNVAPEDMPKQIVICSDMQFDGRYFGWNDTLFEDISDEFMEQGYELPKMIFWNIAGEVFNTIPMKDNDNGLVLCSGFSQSNLNMFIGGESDPYQCLLDVLYSERYAPVLEAYKKLRFQ